MNRGHQPQQSYHHQVSIGLLSRFLSICQMIESSSNPYRKYWLVE